MIAYLRGTIDTILYSGVVYIDVRGVGYEVNVSTNTIVDIQSKKETVTLYTYMNFTQDGVSLFGFSTVEEKEAFIQLIGVSGIGSRMALGILSSISAKQLRQAVLMGNVKEISQAKGVGKKMAQRIILELKDRFSADLDLGEDIITTTAPTDAKKSLLSDAIQVLSQLGFSKSEATAAVEKASILTNDLDKLIEIAIKSMSN